MSTASSILESYLPEEELNAQDKVNMLTDEEILKLGFETINEYAFEEYTGLMDESAFEALEAAASAKEKFEVAGSLLAKKTEEGTAEDGFLAQLNAEVNSIAYFETVDGDDFSLSTESLKDKISSSIKNAGKAIAKFTDTIIKAVKEFFNRHFTKAGRLIKRFEKLEDRASKTVGSAKELEFKAKYSMLVTGQGDRIELGDAMKFLAISMPNFSTFEKAAKEAVETAQSGLLGGMKEPMKVFNDAFINMTPGVMELYEAWGMKSSSPGLGEKLGLIKKGYVQFYISPELPGGYHTYAGLDPRKGIATGIKKPRDKSKNKPKEVAYTTVALPGISNAANACINSLNATFRIKKDVDKVINSISSDFRKAMDKNVNTTSMSASMLTGLFKMSLRVLVNFTRDIPAFITALANDIYEYLSRSLSMYTNPTIEVTDDKDLQNALEYKPA